MSHGKSMMVGGTATVKIGTKTMTFYEEEKYGVADTHGKVTGNLDKGKTSCLGALNLKYDQAWKKEKQTGRSPDLALGDVTWKTFSKK